jgi:hypothetical protein
MEERKKVIVTGLIILVLLIIGGGLYYFLVLDRFHEPKAAGAETAAAGLTEEKAGAAEAEAPSPVALDQSDDYVRANLQGLSAQPLFAAWLRMNGLIRRFVAAVDNIANGLSPRPQLEFLGPDKAFSVVKKGRRLQIDPASYARYDHIGDVVSSLDAASCVKAYRSLKPLIRDAYRELGYPTQDFQDTLVRAVEELLQVPVVRSPITVEKQVLTYVIPDRTLEELSPPQKHLLRMGPENVEIIQSKLRELATALGVPADRLPKARTYAPRSY